MKTDKFYIMIRRSPAWILALLLVIGSHNLTTPALAHGGLEHITGTVTNVGENTVAVKTTKGKTLQVHVDAKTEYIRGKQVAKIGDLKEGDRVAVHAMEMNGSLVAHQVNIGANTKATKATAKKVKK
jgi:Cu/Ag efflux protein CusF